MPQQQGVVGPFPPDQDPEEYDKLRRRVLWTMPSGLYVLGTRAGERRNGMTVNWTTQVASDPKLLAVSVEHEAFSHELLVEGGAFCLNVIGQDDRAIVRKFTKPVDVDLSGRTMNGFPFRDARSGAPVLDLAVAWIDCEVRQQVELGSHTLFVGEIVDAGFGADEDTPVLSMHDTRMNYGG